MDRWLAMIKIILAIDLIIGNAYLCCFASQDAVYVGTVRRLLQTKKVLPRERGGCAKNSENSGRRRIERRKGMKIWDRGSLDVYDASKAEGASSEVNIKSRKSGSEKGEVSR